MISFDDVLIFALVPLGLLLVWLLLPGFWRGKRDAYEEVFIVKVLIGESGRYGFNAFYPIAVVSFTLEYLGVLAHKFDELWTAAPNETFDFLGRLLTGFGMVGILVALGLLLFLRPLFLVPPYLKSRRGWISEVIHARHAKP